jgi:hypothetical protein
LETARDPEGTLGRVFISHISEEKSVALALQKYLKVAFGESLSIFVSTDKTSIGGGQKWFEQIITKLRSSQVVLSLISQESRRREWINFEAGFGDGGDRRVVPVAIRNFPLGQLSFPLAGFQGRSIDDIGALVDDISLKVGLTPRDIDVRQYLADVREAEAQVNYRSLKLDVLMGANRLHFQLQNVGNVDLELLAIQVYVPTEILKGAHSSPSRYVDEEILVRDGRQYRSFACYSSRGAYGGIEPNLRPVITPSMGVLRLRDFEIPLGVGVEAAGPDLSVLHQVHAIGYNSSLEAVKLGDIPAG